MASFLKIGASPICCSLWTGWRRRATMATYHTLPIWLVKAFNMVPNILCPHSLQGFGVVGSTLEILRSFLTFYVKVWMPPHSQHHSVRSTIRLGAGLTSKLNQAVLLALPCMRTTQQYCSPFWKFWSLPSVATKVTRRQVHQPELAPSRSQSIRHQRSHHLGYGRASQNVRSLASRLHFPITHLLNPIHSYPTRILIDNFPTIYGTAVRPETEYGSHIVHADLVTDRKALEWFKRPPEKLLVGSPASHALHVYWGSEPASWIAKRSRWLFPNYHPVCWIRDKNILSPALRRHSGTLQNGSKTRTTDTN